MAQLRLTYFDFSGSRGEDCRMALFICGVDFVDRRLARQEWLALKPETPFGSLPILELDGKPTLAQSNAILGYIGRSYGLYPSDAWDAARHDALLAAVEDLRNSLGPSGKTNDEAEKKRLREEFAVGPLRTWSRSVEAQIKGPFVEGETLYVADLKIFTIMNSLSSGAIDYIPAQPFADFPKLTALFDAVAAHPKVAEWRSRK